MPVTEKKTSIIMEKYRQARDFGAREYNALTNSQQYVAMAVGVPVLYGMCSAVMFGVPGTILATCITYDFFRTARAMRREDVSATNKQEPPPVPK